VAELRGFFLISYNTFIVVGQFLLTLVCRAVVPLAGEKQFEIVILCMFIFPGIILIVWPLFPESPYYLLWKNHDEAGAAKSLRRLHGRSKEMFISSEIVRLNDSIQAANTLMHFGKQPTILDAFRGANLRRTMGAMVATSSTLFTGVIFIVGYLPYFLALAGVSKPFNWAMGLFTINLVSNFFAFYTVEKIGRRSLMVPGLAALCILNFIIGLLNVTPSPQKLMGTIALIYIWAAIYQLCYGAV